MLKNKKYIIYIFLFFLIGFSANYFIDKRNEKLMSKGTIKTYAIYDKNIVFARSGPRSYFNYYVDKQKLSLTQYGKFNFLEKGDTVLIEYSIEGPSAARVIDFKYMQKFKEDRNKSEGN